MRTKIRPPADILELEMCICVNFELVNLNRNSKYDLLRKK